MKPSTEAQLRAEIEELKTRMEQLTKMVEPEPSAGPRFPIWTLVRDWLRKNGGSATPQEITDGLIEAGHNLGKYPLRTVKITLTSPIIRPMFPIKKDATGVETVKLVEGAAVSTYAPRKWVDKKPARRTKR